MIGVVDLSGYGRYVVSGDTPEAFLWDLFDQVVSDGPIQVQLGGPTIAVSRPDAHALDAAERMARRGSADWRQAHSRYFLRQLTDGVLLRSLTLPDELYFPLHAMRLLGIAINETMPGRDHVRRLNIAGYTHGWGTPEYLAELERIPPTDYPYDTLGPTELLNYLLLKGVLTLQGSNPPPFGLVSADEAAAAQRRAAEISARLIDEQARAARASRERQRQSRRRR